MSTGQIVGIGAVLGLLFGGVAALVTREFFYLGLGTAAGAFYAWARRREGLDARGLAQKVGINLVVLTGLLVLLRVLFPRSR